MSEGASSQILIHLYVLCSLYFGKMKCTTIFSGLKSPLPSHVSGVVQQNIALVSQAISKGTPLVKALYQRSKRNIEIEYNGWPSIEENLKAYWIINLQILKIIWRDTLVLSFWAYGEYHFVSLTFPCRLIRSTKWIWNKQI